MDDEVVAEGDLYKLGECARLALEDFRAADGFINAVVEEQGAGLVAQKLAEVMRRRCGNEAAGTFTITKQQLLECYNEMHKVYFNETLEKLVGNGMVSLSLDREGNVCFDPIDAPWNELLRMDPKHKQKGGKGESEKP